MAVQAERSDAIHRYIQTGVYADAPNPSTCADSISVTCPSNAHGARRAVLESRGQSILVNDQDILDAQARLARRAGVFAEPAGAAAAAGLAKLQSGPDALPREARVVILATGHGLKDIDTPLAHIRIPPAIEPRLDCVPV
jgi:threonine synthase